MPFKTINYYFEYFQTIKQINVEKKKSTKWLIYFYMSIILYEAVHHLWMTHFAQSDKDKTIHYAAMYFVSGRNSMEFLSFLFDCSLLYSLNLFYLKSKINNNLILYWALKQKDVGYFSEFSTKQKIAFYGKIKKCFLIILNGFQIFVLNASKLPRAAS